MRDPIRVCSEGKLRVQFLDSVGEPIEATSVTVDLFEPGLDPDADIPTVAGLTPTYLGNGVFEITTTALSPEGTWSDKWTGDILGTTTTAIQTFYVVESGIINSYPITGLFNNSLIEVILSAGVLSTDGDILEDDYSFAFSTKLTPMYSGTRKVRLDAGGL